MELPFSEVFRVKLDEALSQPYVSLKLAVLDTRAGHGFALNYAVVLRKQINVVLPSHRQFSAMIIPCFFSHVGIQNRAPGHL